MSGFRVAFVTILVASATAAASPVPTGFLPSAERQAALDRGQAWCQRHMPGQMCESAQADFIRISDEQLARMAHYGGADAAQALWRKCSGSMPSDGEYGPVAECVVESGITKPISAEEIERDAAAQRTARTSISRPRTAREQCEAQIAELLGYYPNATWARSAMYLEACIEQEAAARRRLGR